MADTIDMIRPVTIALAQHDCTHGDVEANVRLMVDLIERAGNQGADLVVFPELATSGYRQDLMADKLADLAELPEGESFAAIADAARRAHTNVIAGFIEADPKTDALYNSAWIIDRAGELKGVYRKNHAYSTEGRYFAPGNEMPVFELDFGMVGVMICYDMGLPEVARILTLKGAEVIVAPSAWCQEDEDVWDINIPCRALENHVFLAGVNRVGTEGVTLTMMGKSMIAGPRGEILAQAKRFEPDLVVHTVDLAEVTRLRREIPYLDSRKPETYGLISNPKKPR